MAEFQWWLLLVGLVAGGGLVAVVFLDGARRDQDVEDAELPAEAQWIAARLSRGRDLQPRDVEAVLREHREYRLLPPPDRLEPIDPEPADAGEAAAPAAPAVSADEAAPSRPRATDAAPEPPAAGA